MTSWLTVAQAGRRFGVSRTTLYRLLSSGAVQKVKRIGDPKIYVSTEDLEQATSLQPTWVKEWLAVKEHRTRAEEALLQHLRDSTKKRDRDWLRRHAELRKRLKAASDRVAAYLFESEREVGR